MAINFNNMFNVLKSSGNHNFKMGETLDFLWFKKSLILGVVLVNTKTTPK